MPELPEVETMRRGIRNAKGCRILDVERVRCRLRPIRLTPRIDIFRRRVSGRAVSRVDRVGKRVLLELDNSDRIVFEPRMTGLVLVADPPDASHLRFRMKLGGGEVTEILYWDRRGLGSVKLLNADEFADQLGSERLGPDALDLTATILRDRFRRTRREIKVALLDQRAVAGIGNLYASEILHVAGLHPGARCDQLTKAQWGRLHTAILEVLSEAVHYEGSTLADGTYRNALNNPGQYQNHHRVYAKTGEPCSTCRQASIRRIVQAQRATFFCPHCQRRRRAT